MGTGILDGKSILVVEDDPLVAEHIASALRQSGARVIGPAPTVHYARLVCGTRPPDGALLDIGLFNEIVFPLVDDLMESGVPVVFLTGRSREEIPAEYRFVETFFKPLPMEAVVQRAARFERGAPLSLPVRQRVPGNAAPAAARPALERERWGLTLTRAALRRART